MMSGRVVTLISSPATVSCSQAAVAPVASVAINMAAYTLFTFIPT
jgi:hypothetical protein